MRVIPLCVLRSCVNLKPDVNVEGQRTGATSFYLEGMDEWDPTHA